LDEVGITVLSSTIGGSQAAPLVVERTISICGVAVKRVYATYTLPVTRSQPSRHLSRLPVAAVPIEAITGGLSTSTPTPLKRPRWTPMFCCAVGPGFPAVRV